MREVIARIVDGSDFAKFKARYGATLVWARIWDDGIIDPLDTRRVLAIGLAAARYKAPKETKFGVFRM